MYVVPLGPYVAVTGFDDVGPKFVPVNVIVVPPAVGIDAPPATPDTAGAVYDDVPLEEVLVCVPTVTLHTKLAPTPATLLHWICVFATATVHPLAAYVVPVVPYVAVTVFPDVGPKSVPVKLIVVPPPVPIDEPPATAVIAGAVYDVVPLDDALVCDPTVTFHTKLAPTPATLVH